jgi:hypothetical protein
MMAAMWGCQSVSASLPIGSKTVTMRLSSRLRPLSRLSADPIGVVVAQVSAICRCRVGWLSLTWTIRPMLAVAAISKCFLAVHRIEGDDGAVGDPEFGQQRLRRRDLVGLVGDVDMGEHERGVGSKGGEHLGSGAIAEIVEAAAQRLAIQRDAALSVHPTSRLQQGGVAAEDRLHRGRIEPLQDVTDGSVRGRPTPLQREGGLQPLTMDVDESDDAAIRVAAGHDGEDGEQQHIRQLVELALRPARIRDVCQHIQQR